MTHSIDRLYQIAARSAESLSSPPVASTTKTMASDFHCGACCRQLRLANPGASKFSLKILRHLFRGDGTATTASNNNNEKNHLNEEEKKCFAD